MQLTRQLIVLGFTILLIAACSSNEVTPTTTANDTASTATRDAMTTPIADQVTVVGAEPTGTSEPSATLTRQAAMNAATPAGGSGDILSQPSEERTLANEAAVHTLVMELPSATGGLAVDADGNLYAANIGPAPSRTGSEIYRITPAGDYQLWIEGQGLRGASGNAFDAQGNLIQSSLRASAIHHILPEGKVTELTREGINSPVGITIAGDGTIYVANCGGNSIQRITPAGESLAFASSALLACPNGITLDDAGNLYVANFFGGAVVKITPEGEAADFADVPGGNNGHIFYLNGLLYVVSRGGHQIYTLTLDGELTLFAGTGERGHTDGPATQATFSLPNDIVASPDGNRLYVNEVVPIEGTANNPSRIRVIELPRDD